MNEQEAALNAGPLDGLLADLLGSWQEPMEAELETSANAVEDAPDIRVLAAALVIPPDPAPLSPPPPPEPRLAGVLPEPPELQLPAVILSVEPAWIAPTPEAAADIPTDFPLDVSIEPATESIVELAAAVEAPPPAAEEPAGPRDRFVAFECAGRLYGLPLDRVAEVERVPHLTAVPGAPPIMCGLINRRGDIVPLIDLRLLLSGSPADDPQAGRLVMAAPEPGEESLAFLVDRLAGLASIGRSDIARPGEGAPASCMAGRATHRGRELIVLDSSALREETQRCFEL